MPLKSQLQKVQTHYKALREYRDYIRKIVFDYSPESYEQLPIQDRGVLEAYLKRFASLQDYLGAKVFKSLLDARGISYTKMSEVLTLMENEGVIDLEEWIEFRNLRNNLEHDYPDELEEALEDLRECVEAFDEMEAIIQRVLAFAGAEDARF